MSDERRKRAILAKVKLYQKAVRTILFHEWDPIGISEYGPADEYDTYVDQICAKLIRGEDRDQLANYLWWAESGNMGMPGNRQRTYEIALRLLQVRDELESHHDRP